MAGFAGVSRPQPPGGRIRNPGASQIAADRLSPDMYGRFDAPQGPAQPAQGNYLLLLLFAQDIAHVVTQGMPRDGFNVLDQPHWPVFK